MCQYTLPLFVNYALAELKQPFEELVFSDQFLALFILNCHVLVGFLIAFFVCSFVVFQLS